MQRYSIFRFGNINPTDILGSHTHSAVIHTQRSYTLGRQIGSTVAETKVPSGGGLAGCGTFFLAAVHYIGIQAEAFSPNSCTTIPPAGTQEAFPCAAPADFSPCCTLTCPGEAHEAY